MSDRPPPSSRLVLLAFGLVTLTAWLCAAPILERPQLDPDDARYLQITRGASHQGEPAPTGLQALVVENRWDHLWWLDVDDVVRFFRPAVVTSYAIDDAIAPRSFAQQAMLTNLLVHMAAGLMFALLCLRWLPPVAALLSTALFVAFAAHGENLWFVAGRTGSLAGLGVLATVAFHVQRGGPASRCAALAAFACGLLAKETAAVAPLLCLAADVLVERRGRWAEMLRRDRLVYAGYAAVLVAYLVLRSAAIGGGVTFVKPYLVSPLEPGFVPHLASQLISYTQNLSAGTESPPFSDLDKVLGRADAGSWIGMALLLGLLGCGAWRAHLGRFGLLWLALTWLPASIAYISERYLYLPSAGLALVAGAACASVRKPQLQALAFAVLGLWTLHQGWNLHLRNHYHGVERTRELTRLAETLEPVSDQIPDGATLWLVNVPGSWIAAQFAEPGLQFLLDDPNLRVRVLNLVAPLPPLGREVRAAWEPDGALRVWSDGAPVLFDHPPGQPWRSMAPETEVPRRETGLDVQILEGEPGAAFAVRFRAVDPTEAPLVLLWHPDPDEELRPTERLRRSRVEMLSR